MARYTSLFTVAVSFERLWHLLTDILHSCRMDVIYTDEDYLVARELPGHVSFGKLVTVEVLIDRFVVPETMPDTRPDAEVRMNIVVKNEELPLQSDNHCRQMFNLVNRAVSESQQWHLIDSAASSMG